MLLLLGKAGRVVADLVRPRNLVQTLWRARSRCPSALGVTRVGGIGQYDNIWRMAYVRGPERTIVSLAERIG